MESAMQSIKIDSHWLNITYVKREQQKDVYFRVYAWAAMGDNNSDVWYRKKEVTNPNKTLTQDLEEAKVFLQLYVRHDQSHSLCFGDPEATWDDRWFAGEFPWELECFGVALAKCWEIAQKELADVWVELPDE